MGRARNWLGLIAATAALVLAGVALGAGHGNGNGNGNHPVRNPPKRTLVATTTGRSAELRKTIPISTTSGLKPKVVLSLGPDRLPNLKRGDKIQARAEVTLTTTCVDPLPRCIGNSYRYDPRLDARIVIARNRNAVGNKTKPISRRIELTCTQHRPNRNHHCPLVIDQAGTTIKRLGRLPCNPKKCHLNVVVNASNPKAGNGQVVVVGADRPNGSIKGGKARLSASISRKNPGVRTERHKTKKLRTHSLPASFSGGARVVLSQRLDKLHRGDVLLVRSRQRTAIRRIPYFVSSQIIVTTRRDAEVPTAIARRAVSRLGTVTEVNGFNCTSGPSAFQSPCSSPKTGVVAIQRTPRDKSGQRRRLFVNVVSRSFPKIIQGHSRSRYRPAKVLSGKLEVIRLRAKPRPKGHHGHGGHHGNGRLSRSTTGPGGTPPPG